MVFGPEGHHLGAHPTDIPYMERWLVECVICGRGIEIASRDARERPTMGTHAVLGPDGETVVEGSRCIGSDRSGRWTPVATAVGGSS
jgi:hypothetical protein